MQIMSEDIKEIAKALCEVQGKIKNVIKDVNGYNYKYADLGSCINTIRDPLKENGLSLTQILAKEGDELVLISLLMHTSGQWIKSSFPLNANDIPLTNKMSNKMQALGSIISYARRYSLSAIVGLAQEDDDASSLESDQKRNFNTPYNQSEINKFNKRKELATLLKDLCDQKGIKLVPFTKFYNLESSNLEELEKTVNNFNQLYEEYPHKL